MPIEEVLNPNFSWCASWEKELRRLFSAYVDAKQRAHVLDYDDLLKGDREKCLEAGASDYLAKPVNTEQLLSSLRMWLHR
jgi:CheY-like chemotaxis protein